MRSLPETIGSYPRSNATWLINQRGDVARLPVNAVKHESRKIKNWAYLKLTEEEFWDDTNSNIFYLTIVPVMGCNLACPYCIQNISLPEIGKLISPRVPNKVLSIATLERTKEFAQQQMIAQSKDELDILLFGGEPLLRPDLCESVLKEFNAIVPVRASIITNATLLSAAIATKLQCYGLESIQVTFDGSHEDHDKQRHGHDGSPSYGIIVDAIREVQSSTEIRCNLRINVTVSNLDRIPLLLRDLSEKISTSGCAISFALIDDIGFGYDKIIKYSSQNADLLISFYSLASELEFSIGLGSPPSHNCVYCGNLPENGGGMVVNADGLLYSCWDDLGREERSVGSVYDGYLPKEQYLSRWNSCGLTVDGQNEIDKSTFYQSVNDGIANILIERATR